MYSVCNRTQKCLIAAAFVASQLCANVAAAAPEPGAIQAALGGERQGIASVYAARAHAPIWLAGEGAAARALVAALNAAGDHALSPASYGAGPLAQRLSASGALNDAGLEVALTRAYLAFARDLSGGRVDPASAGPNVFRRVDRASPATLLQQAAASFDIAAHLARLAPQDPDYAPLAARYRALRDIAASGDWGPLVPPGATLRPGAVGPRVAAMRARLARMGDLVPAAAAADPAQFGPALAQGLRAFQRRHGLNADAVLGPATLAALNISAAKRADQIAVNLERMRWTNHQFGREQVVVNIPAFSVQVTRGGALAFEERVIVGTGENQTPEFSDEMELMVLNPAWNVPRSITVKEMLPKLRRDPGYLRRRGMELISASGAVDPATIDFSAYNASNFPYRIKQLPADDNALGQVKFLFPNRHAIYLHDTPSKRLFSRDNRAFSHGCVRVRDPLTLAEILLVGQVGDPAGYVRNAIRRGREKHVRLASPIPVHLVYRTVFIDRSGAIQYRGDIYGRDRAVAAALRASGALAAGA